MRHRVTLDPQCLRTKLASKQEGRKGGREGGKEELYHFLLWLISLWLATAVFTPEVGTHSVTTSLLSPTRGFS